MDAWAAASHYLDYKTDIDIPQELRKDFFALSGLFYVADRHFEIFANERAKALTAIEKKMTAPVPDLAVEINLDSLAAYLRSKFKDRKHIRDDKALSELVQQLRNGDLTTIKQLDDVVDAGWSAFLRSETEDPPKRSDNKPTVYTDIGTVRTLCSIVSEKFLSARTDTGGEMKRGYRRYRQYVGKPS